jgi:zinc/manganese transport system permease protein
MTVMRMPAEIANPRLGWNLLQDLGEVLEYHFMLNALIAGAVVAVMAALAGWLMVLRGEAFAGHTLSMMAFPGASAAALIGIPAAWGYFAFCGAGALAIGRLPGGRRSWSEESASIGAVQAVALAAGFLFVSLYGGVLGDLEGLLFGNVLGVSDGQVLTLLAVGVAVVLALGALARPLLFASVDADLASARGVPVRAVSSGFLLVLGLAVAATSQVTGVLLVFALLVGPPASAQAITARPALGLLLSVAFGLLVVWLGLAIAYFSVYPAGFFIATISATLYVLMRLLDALLGHRRKLSLAPVAPQPPPAGVIA